MILMTNTWVMIFVANKEIKRKRQITLVTDKKKTKDIVANK